MKFCLTSYLPKLVPLLAGSPTLQQYLLREQKYIQSDTEFECARIATLVCVVKNLERGRRPA